MTESASRPVFEALRRVAQSRRNVERCEFCGAGLALGHRHVLEKAARKVVCACDPCALRFENVIGRWKLIPRDTRRLENFQITDNLWDALSLPINLAFFFNDSAKQGATAMYPGPTGVTESLLSLESWRVLLAQNPVLAQMQDDVEALLVNRLGEIRDNYLAPIDRCYELAGIIRLHWRGLSGGVTVWEQIKAFFERLERPARLGQKAVYA